jgi:hypothetical protein
MRDEHCTPYLRFALFSSDIRKNKWTPDLFNVRSFFFILISLPQAHGTSHDRRCTFKDFPSLRPSSPTAVSNPTHTSFSRSLLSFLTSPCLSLSTAGRSFAEDFKSFHFSSSKDLRLVWSPAGEWEGDEEVEEAGGLYALAQAVRELKPVNSGNGEWEVEYLVRPLHFRFVTFLTLPSRRFIETRCWRLHLFLLPCSTIRRLSRYSAIRIPCAENDEIAGLSEGVWAGKDEGTAWCEAEGREEE